MQHSKIRFLVKAQLSRFTSETHPKLEKLCRRDAAGAKIRFQFFCVQAVGQTGFDSRG
jgi:hypothetical protein